MFLSASNGPSQPMDDSPMPQATASKAEVSGGCGPDTAQLRRFVPTDDSGPHKYSPVAFVDASVYQEPRGVTCARA